MRTKRKKTLEKTKAFMNEFASWKKETMKTLGIKTEAEFLEFSKKEVAKNIENLRKKSLEIKQAIAESILEEL